MQHAEDYNLSKNGMINSGIIATKLGLSGIPAAVSYTHLTLPTTGSV